MNIIGVVWEQLLNTLPLCTTIVFVGRRSLKNEAEHNRRYSYSMTCKEWQGILLIAPFVCIGESAKVFE